MVMYDPQTMYVKPMHAEEYAHSTVPPGLGQGRPPMPTAPPRPAYRRPPPAQGMSPRTKTMLTFAAVAGLTAGIFVLGAMWLTGGKRRR